MHANRNDRPLIPWLVPLLLVACAAHAGTTTWTGTGVWPGTEANWSNGVPGAGDSVILASGELTLTESTPPLAAFTQTGGTLVMRHWDTALVAGAVTLNGGVLIHPPQSALEPVDDAWVPDHRVWIRCDTFTLNTDIDLSARGFRNGQGFNLPGKGPGGGQPGGGGRGSQGGGGYGGHGGDRSGGTAYGGAVYGAPEAPQHWPGSGGGNRDQHGGGHGGGLFVLEAEGHVTLNGAIRVNGGHAANIYGGGGGSGGGVAIRAATLAAVNAAISANGGNGGTFASGSGGGGRIAISISDPAGQDALPTPDLTLRARFGTQSYAMQYGGYGTFWLDHASLLPAEDSGTYGYFHGPVVPDWSETIRDLSLHVAADGALTLSAPGHTFVAESLPVVNQVVLETQSPDADGFVTYAFEDADLSDAVRRALPEGDGVELTYPWGALRFRYAVTGDRFDLVLTVTNHTDRTIANLDLRLMELAFPDTPKRSESLVSNRDRPGVTHATWGVESHGGALFACIETHDDPFQIGFAAAIDTHQTRFPLVARGGLPSFVPGDVAMFPLGLPRIGPGETLQLGFSLRHTAHGIPEHEALADLYAAFRAAYPSVVDWPDRRPIGAIFFISRGPISATNPRGWFNDPNLDVFSAAGLDELERRFLQSAHTSVGVLTAMGAQGAIVWNVEGEEFPHAISYIGDPRLQATLAPELNGFIDAYFQVYRDAGLRTGVTLRPTQPYQPDPEVWSWTHGTGSHGPARNPHNESFDAVWPAGLRWQHFFPIVERLSRKIAFAHERWGATIFYLDTNGIHPPMGPEQDHTRMLLDHWVYRELRARFPDILIIPEHARGPACFAVVAPYDQLDFTKRTTTPAHVRRLYSDAFVCNYVANTSRDLLARGEPWFDALVSAVARGDVLMHRGWFADGLNNDVRAIYGDAARQAPLQVYIGDELLLNGEPVAGIPALTAALIERFSPEPPPLSERRVYVGIAAERTTPIQDLNPVLDAIIAGGGIIAWSQVMPAPPQLALVEGATTDTAVTVQVTCATPGAILRYTTDGSDPSGTSPEVAPGGTVTLPRPGTLSVRAEVAGLEPSHITRATYQLQRIAAGFRFQISVGPVSAAQYFRMN